MRKVLLLEEEKQMSFEELKDIILKSKSIKSEYQQACIVILREIFKKGSYDE